jgi:hypothetical protein
MNKKIFSIIVVAALMILTSHLYATGMGDFTYDNNGSGSGSGSAGVPIDGGLSAMIIGAAGYAYKKLKKVKE